MKLYQGRDFPFRPVGCLRVVWVMRVSGALHVILVAGLGYTWRGKQLRFKVLEQVSALIAGSCD